MRDYQRDFLQLAVEVGALRFGTFTLKSGRQSPYFFDCGRFSSGAALARLARCYAAAYAAAGFGCDTLFGPAYKGIPLAAATAAALADRHGIDMPFAYNRKEAKDHGEGGVVVGKLAGRVVIVDDVVSAGTAVREAVALIRAAGAVPSGLLVALDREERGSDSRAAMREMAEAFELKTTAIAGFGDLLAYVTEDAQLAAFRAPLEAYRDIYGTL